MRADAKVDIITVRTGVHLAVTPAQVVVPLLPRGRRPLEQRIRG